MEKPQPTRPPGALDYLAKAGKLRSIPESDQDYGTEAEQTSIAERPSNLPPQLEVFAARAVLACIRRLQEQGPDPARGVRLSEVGRDIDMTADALFPLARRLEAVGLLSTTEPDSFGDNTVILTEEAIQALDSRDPQVLTHLLQTEIGRGGSTEPAQA
jgi:hypothetical protein